MRKIYFHFLIWVLPTFIFTNAFSQTSLIGYSAPYSYYVAETEGPDSNWINMDFDDSSWPVDTFAIGFGYEYLKVEVPTSTRSIYLRYKFNVNNPKAVPAMSFLGDFDDGYVAYLNGKQIIRKHIPDSLATPEYNSLSTRSHESALGARFPVYGVFLDSKVVDSTLIEGENILCVQVINDSVNGSDLYYHQRLYSISPGTYSIYGSPFRYKREYHVDSSNFPLVIIETDEYGIPTKNERVRASMGIIDNGEGRYNHAADSFNVFSGEIDIEVRGQSSSDFPKKTYRFEIKDAHEGDSNVVLLGMPANDDWILFGPFQDKAHFRNKMIFDLGRKQGYYEPRSEFCEVVLNGEYVGLYTLRETIKRDSARVDVARLRESEISGIDVTGGYILKYDKPNGFQIHYPKPKNIQPQQVDYILNYMNEVQNMLFSDQFWDPVIGFRRYVNDVALADYALLTEFCKNGDGYFNSTYFYKDRADRDDRLHMGPLWDYDLVFGNTSFQEGNLTYGWQFEHPMSAQYIKMTRFLQDEDFASLFKQRWHDARASYLSDDAIYSYIDSMVNYLADPIARNYEVWPVIGELIFGFNYPVSSSYEHEISNMKSWIEQRLTWIDDNIDDIYYEPVYYPDYLEGMLDGYMSVDVFPNPFRNAIVLSIATNASLLLEINLYSITGQLVFSDSRHIESSLTEINLDDASISILPPGVYVMEISSKGQLIQNKKLIKQ